MKKITVFMILSLLLLAGCNNSTDTAKETVKEATASEQKQQKSTVEEEVHQNPIMDYVKEGEVNADIMTIGMEPEKSKEAMVIATKMQASLAEKREWFTNYMSQVKEGEVMPYHPNLGITKEEYQFLLDSEKDMKLVKKGETPITVTREGNLLTLKATNTTAIKTLTIDLKANTVKTDYGILSYDGEIEASDEQVVTGPWSGHSWNLKEGNLNQIEDINNMDENTEMKNIDFSIGKLKETGEIIVYLKTFEIKNLEKNQNEEILLFK
ncbi:hypothetical protein ABET51_15425 [Metabacillus fastidiosus]|uniref:hypothetical protein n=1 Tax=Metabacillus fastidiosus TaxID=1458 RepID=UPI003D285575